MTGATLSGFTVPDSKPEWKIQEYGKTNRQNSAGNVYLGFSMIPHYCRRVTKFVCPAHLNW